MQIVYISNRPDTFFDTLKYVVLLMPFIDEVLVCVPDDKVKEFEEPQTKLPITIVPESHLTIREPVSALSELDHQRRNYYLRSQLIRLELIKARFIMSDDDARPLKPISLNDFYFDGKYRSYYFYDMSSWDNNQTEFDVGQISTFATLNVKGLKSFSFASHMPQIIDRDLFLESVVYFNDYACLNPICEWSSYFNFATFFYPDRFHEPEIFKTLCWPEHPLSWKLYVRPKQYLFENYTRSLYDDVFSGLGLENSEEVKVALIEKQSIEKIIRWKRHSITLRKPEQLVGKSRFLLYKTWVNKLLMHRDRY